MKRKSVKKKGYTGQGIVRLPSGKYNVAKRIKGFEKRFSATFESLDECLRWKKYWHPDSGYSDEISTLNGDYYQKSRLPSTTLLSVYYLFLKERLPKHNWRQRNRMKNFCPELFNIHMGDISPKVISSHIEKMVSDYKKDKPNGPRCNFEKEIGDIRRMFHYWQQGHDDLFINPVRDFHNNLGFIKEIPDKKRSITKKELLEFFDGFNILSGDRVLFYKDFAEIQFYIAGRVGEVAALTIEQIDFKKRSIKIDRAIAWDNNGDPIEKSSTKTKTVRYSYINDRMLEILNRRVAEMIENQRHIWQLKGLPLRYTNILANYRIAQRAANLSQSGTHILRYGSASLVADLAEIGENKIQNVKEMTGHKTSEMAEKYSKRDNGQATKDNKRISELVAESMK